MISLWPLASRSATAGVLSTAVEYGPATIMRRGQPGISAPFQFITRSQPSWCPMMISGTPSPLMSEIVGEELRSQFEVWICQNGVRVGYVAAPAGPALTLA